MWIGIISLLPQMFQAVTEYGVLARAVRQGILEVEHFNPRDYAEDRHRTVDDRPYGGGAGMVMMADPLRQALDAAKARAPQAASAKCPVVLMSPQGAQFDQERALQTSKLEGMIIICGRYEGLDERFVTRYVDEECSIGDYVVSGGELPAMIVIDAIARHLPGTLGNHLSVQDESYLDGTLDYPQYTRPESFEDDQVPEVLMSGDHRRIGQFRRRASLLRTLQRRPDLLTGRVFSEEDRLILNEWFTLNEAEGLE